MVLKVKALAVIARVQPSSLAIGLKNTPNEYLDP